MPLIIEGRVPNAWAGRATLRPPEPLSSSIRGSHGISIAFINNMPDSAIEDTEVQFLELLDDASQDVPVLLKFFSLSGVPRGDRGQRHIDNFYLGIDDLWDSQFDGMIMTGTEPRCSDIRQEAYWPSLAQALDWAERNTSSTILSCLAAHAGVLHSDGIARNPLPDKQFGVFEFTKSGSHQLISNTGTSVRFPHSRWNEVKGDALAACGYTVMTQSAEGGVDSFVKKKKQSLFVHFQGHPEYGAQTLLKEYRRDIRRFVKKERETYPSMPKGYFDSAGTIALTKFRDVVLSERHDDVMQRFPEAAVQSLQKTWHSSAVGVYRNWLRYLLVSKAELARIPVLSSVRIPSSRKRSALR